MSAGMNLTTSTIRAILKNKEKFCHRQLQLHQAKIIRPTHNAIEEMENDRLYELKNIPLSHSINKEKARRIFSSIQAEANETFASRGRFCKNEGGD